MESVFHNPCGGVRWRELPDGTFEVEGAGVPLPETVVADQVWRTWQNFTPEIMYASSNRGVPLSWLIAIIATETGLWSSSRERQAAAHSDCCAAPAAVMLSNYKLGGYSSTRDMFDPAKNIDTGAAIMHLWMAKGYDLPAICAGYNAGSVCCPNSPVAPNKPGGRVKNEFNLCSATISGVPYPLWAIRNNNFAILSKMVGPGVAVYPSTDDSPGTPGGSLTAPSRPESGGGSSRVVAGAAAAIAVVSGGIWWMRNRRGGDLD